MNAAHFLGWFLGLDDAQSVERVALSFGAGWAQEAPAWLLFGGLALAAAAVFVYFRATPGKKRRAFRAALAAARSLALGLVLLALAEPVVNLQVVNRPRPSLWLLLDGTDSMNIADDYSAAARSALAKAVELPAAASQETVPARIDYVRAWLRAASDNTLSRLEERFRIRPFLFEQSTGVRQLDAASDGRANLDQQRLAEQLTTRGQTTAIGAAIADLSRRHATSSLAGLIIVSDFNQNVGPSAVDAARQLGVKVFPIGVGPVAAADVSIALQAPLVTKKDERATLTAVLHQQGLNGAQAVVKVTAKQIGPGAPPDAAAVVVGQKSLRLAESMHSLEFAYAPDRIGQFELTAEVEPVEGESTRENNHASREVNVRDDFIRLLFAEYEPTWEWRFIKEVFHRDKLVGMRGFRTFLRSSDPRVRRTNPLFLASLTPPRPEFFANDVIMLGDMPTAALSPRFCEMVEEFVGNFGGGLVVMAGPRFGPGELADTALAKMLPVVVAPASKPHEGPAFRLKLRPEAGQFDFMQLGVDAAENDKAWRNLGALGWYQPVERPHPLAAVLAEHPTDLTSDGKTHQPLIAVRRYGRGEVVYLAFNEMWRLRRMYGEQYYRQFWGQMIHRLALSHALGAQKRFVVRTDRRRYQVDDQAVLSVEAYDEDFQPLAETAVPGGALKAELTTPAQAGSEKGAATTLAVPAQRKGLFEARIPIFTAGEHRLRVFDPLTGEPVEVSFQAVSVSMERQRPVRDVALQQALADATGGKAYDLTTAARLPDEIDVAARGERRELRIALWNTWGYFAAVVGLLLAELLVRKGIHLP